VSATLRVEDVEQREQIVLVGAAPVKQHQRTLGLTFGRPLTNDHCERASRGFGSGARICSTCARYCS
jgi:hypothetical protein